MKAFTGLYAVVITPEVMPKFRPKLSAKTYPVLDKNGPIVMRHIPTFLLLGSTPNHGQLRWWTHREIVPITTLTPVASGL